MTESDIGSAEQNAVLWRHFQQHEPDVFTGARPRLTRLAKEVMRRCGRSPVVLTIGIGDGTLERLLRDRGCDVYSLDPDESTVERLQSQGMHAQTGFIETMPYKDAVFAAVVASEVLEHLTAEQSRRGLEHVARVLKIGGWFIGTVPYREILDLNRAVCPDCGRVFHRWGHCRSFDEATLRAELEQHFAIVQLDHRAFVSFRGRSPMRIVSGAAHWVLGRFGYSVAYPNIFFVARQAAAR